MMLKPILYSLSFLFGLSLSSDGADGRRVTLVDTVLDLTILAPQARERLQKITKEMFPVLKYDEEVDLISDQQNVFPLQPPQSSRWFDFISNDYIMYWRFPHRYKESPGNFVSLNKDVIIYYLHFLDETTLMRLRRTCKFFYVAGEISGLYLNENCLRETVPNSMQESTVIWKTKNAKDGLFKLANLQSISPERLLALFGKDYLEKFLLQQEELPKSIVGPSEQELVRLFPLVKIAVASIPSGSSTNLRRRVLLLQLYEEHLQAVAEAYDTQSQGQTRLDQKTQRLLSFPSMRFLSIHPDKRFRTGGYLLAYFHDLPHQITTARPSSYGPVDIMARDFILAGNIAPVIDRYLLPNPYHKESVIQLIQWCCETRWDMGNVQVLYRASLHLQQSNLAESVFRTLLETSDDSDLIDSKISLFVDYAAKDPFKERIGQFAQRLRPEVVVKLRPRLRVSALQIFMRAGLRRVFQKSFAAFMANPQSVLASTNDELLADMFQYRFHEEAEQLAAIILDGTMDTFCPTIRDLRTFIIREMQRNQPRIVSLINAELISRNSRMKMPQRLDALTVFAEFKNKPPVVVKELVRKTDLLYNIWNNVMVHSSEQSYMRLLLTELQFSKIYYHLDRGGQCREHYGYAKDLAYLQTPNDQLNILINLHLRGWNINSWDVLLGIDPFVYFSQLDEKGNQEDGTRVLKLGIMV